MGVLIFLAALVLELSSAVDLLGAVFIQCLIY